MRILVSTDGFDVIYLMGKLDEAVVKKIANLAKLVLTSEDTRKLTSQLDKVLDHISELSKVKIPPGILPTSQTTGKVNELRQDEIRVEDILPVSNVFANTKNKHNGYFVVSSVFDN